MAVFLLQKEEYRMIDTRRYDIDWLRVIAFVFLILYHIGMFYVADWGWHVKSAYQSEFLQNIMLLVNPWRMSLIFLISGVALSLVEPKITVRNLLKIRFTRIFIPLVIGMYLIVPPQLFFELMQKRGFDGSYFSFMKFYVNPDTNMYPQHQYGALGLLTWNHLWYLVYIFAYSLVYMLIKPLLTRINWKSLNNTLSGKYSAIAIFIISSLVLVFYSYTLKPHFPTTHALVDDWYNNARYFSVFMFGYFLAKSSHVWQTIIEKRRVWLTLAICHYILLLILRHDVLNEWLSDSGKSKFIIQWILHANVVAWLFTVVGFAGAYLNKGSKVLSYMNEAILPWYILHQTVIIIVGVALATLSLGGFVEPVLVIVFTFGICALAYEGIKRISLLRFMFGMKREYK